MARFVKTRSTPPIAGLAFLALALIGGAAAAQTAQSDQAATDPAAGKTREQVRAELVAAQRAGEIPVGFVAMTKREIDPAHYGATTAEQQLARSREDADKRQSTQ